MTLNRIAATCVAFLLLAGPSTSAADDREVHDREARDVPDAVRDMATSEPADASSILAAYRAADGGDAVLVAGEDVAGPARRGVTANRNRRGGWELVVGLYGWIADTDGEVWVDGEREEIEVPFDDIVENVDFGIQAYFEVRYRRFFVAVDLTYSEIRADFNVFRTAVDVGVDQTILEVKAGYRVLGSEFGVDKCDPCAWPPRCPAVDLFAGVRYWRTDTTIKRATPGAGPLPPSGATFSDVEDWADLIFGVRYIQPLGQRFSLNLRGDYGGFGIGDSAQSTWQLTGGVAWHFARRWSVLLGWRVMNVDHVTGNGSNKNGSDMIQSGPLFSIGYRF